jgi:glycerol-3-phosphate cytidylyltransferase-like family protein
MTTSYLKCSDEVKAKCPFAAGFTHVAMISGYFDPIQPGHVEYIQFALEGSYIERKEGEYVNPFVIAVIHTPEDIVKKAGFYIYEVDELKDLLEAYGVNQVVTSVDTDGTNTKTLEEFLPQYFVKGPDRNPQNMVQSEVKICEEIGCKIVYQTGSKKNSSSSIKKRIKDQLIPKF